MNNQRVRFYSKWYSATTGANVFAWRFRLASNRYIVCENVNEKVCQYQVMISNGYYLRKLISNIFFIKYFTINYILNFLYIIFNEKSFCENFSLT